MTALPPLTRRIKVNAMRAVFLAVRDCVTSEMADAWEEEAVGGVADDDEMRLEAALGESVTLQSHYAELLNGWDGGQRLTFPNADAWLKRLDQIERETSLRSALSK